MTRPYLKARTRTWRDKDSTATPGIALMRGPSVQAHLTYLEARTLADRIHDLCDAAGNPEEPLPTTSPED
ncbi:hypothetical protein GCM10023081_20020 [Arthrobacter ginkgonis]|uniref:Uncharacterized protein n=1 Tax=Arthrobacter ginkgonis TaxID=1630594 RepID=A0ABP7C9J5_9MICC